MGSAGAGAAGVSAAAGASFWASKGCPESSAKPAAMFNQVFFTRCS